MNPIDESRMDWQTRMKAGGVEACPLCHHIPQLRHFQFTSTMVLALIHLYHVRSAKLDAVPPMVATGDSLRKLCYWGLARMVSDVDIAITHRGDAVVKNELDVPMTCVAAHGEPMFFEGDCVRASTLLDSRYSYEDLMGETA